MAAKAINITQPALSRIIRNMETRHGIRLFERTTTGVVLTEAGEAFMPHARMLLFELEEAAEELRAAKGLRKGVVRVGAVSAVVRTILAPSVARLLEAAPHLRVQITESHDDHLFQRLRNNEIDLVISADTHESQEVRAIAQCELEDAYTVFCRSGHPFSGRRVSPHEILPGNWVMPPATSTPRKLFEEIVRLGRYDRPNISIETTSPSVMIACATHADILGWLPEPVTESACLAQFICRIDVPEFRLRRKFFVFRRSRGLLNPATKALLQALPLM